MQINVNTSNITTLRVGVEFDIYNRKVTFSDLSIYGGSSGSGRFNVLGLSFLLQDQEGVDLATINFSDPLKYIVPGSQSEFEVDLSSLSYQFIFQTYKIQAAIKDADGTIYSIPVIYKKVCQPSNITEGGYVPGIFQVTPNCTDNVLTVKELTPFVYSNLSPLLTTKSGSLSYPTGTIGAVSFTGTPFSNNAIYTGEYRIVCTSLSEYDLGDDVSVLVTYLTNNVFDVTCANKIADLICCMVQLQTTYLKNCNTAVGKNAKQQLDEITVPFLLGLTKEINGQDASNEALLIRKTLNCDCGATSLRQNEFTPINPSATNIVLSGVGGTTIPSPTINGNTKTYNIASNVYQVIKGNTGDLAFTIETDTASPYIVKYKITFNYNQMAAYILSAISSDANLVQQLNSLISATGSVDLSGLDGKCIIDLTSANYFLTQTVNATTKIVSFSVAAVDYTAPANLYASSPGTVQTWLNSLGLGTFTVTYNSGVFSILSIGNTNKVGTIVFSNPDLTVAFQSNNATLVSVLQAIIDYLCTLTSLQITLGDTITLWQLDYNGNVQSQSFTNGTSQGALNQGIANSIYNIIQTLLTLTGVTCVKIKSLFQDSPSSAFESTDRLYGTLGGNCAALTDKQVANLVIAAMGKYSDVKDAFCAVSCTSPASCPEIAGISVAMVGNSIGFYGASFASATSSVQAVTLKYKPQSTTSYTTASSNIQLFPNGTINGTSPFLIGGLTQGVTYDILVVNNCGGVGFVGQITVPTGAAYSGSYMIENILYLLCGVTPVTLYTGSPFGVGQIVYTDAGLTVPLTGYSYIADNTGAIFTINPSTGVVLLNTGSSCSTGVSNNVNLDTSSVSICNSRELTKYTNGVFAVGGTLYADAALTTPVVGFSYVLNYANYHIYNLNSVTGVIGADTGLTCSTYTDTYRRSNGSICIAATETLYSALPFGTGVTMYTDAGLTIPATGYSEIMIHATGDVYLINSLTGVVGAYSFNCY